MKHKFSNTPSLGWIESHYRKHINRWIEFQFTEEFQLKFFDRNDLILPVVCKGIFCGFRKKPVSGLHLEFRKLSFIYEGNPVDMGIKTRENVKWFNRLSFSFSLNDIKLKFKTKLNNERWAGLDESGEF